METILFWLSKTVWLVLAPSHFFLLLLLAALIMRRRVLRMAMMGVALFVLCAALIFPVGNWALLPLERCADQQGVPMNVDGVIIMGGAVDNGVTHAKGAAEFNHAADRVMAMIKLMRTYPKAQFVYTGGSSSMARPNFSEAEYVKRALEEMGIDTAAIIFEGRSRNTYEDVILNKEQFTKAKGQSWLIVTSAYHMPRTIGLFNKVGAEIQTRFYPHPVDYLTAGRYSFAPNFDLTSNLAKLDTAVREYLGLLVNRMLGRSAEFFSCTNRTMGIQ